MNIVSFGSFGANYSQRRRQVLRNDIKERLPEKSKNSNIVSERNFFRMLAPLTISGLITVGNFSSCKEDRIFEKEDINGIKIEYSNISKDARDSVIIPLLSLKNKLSEENDFLRGVVVNIAGEYDDMDDNHSFKVYLKNDTETEREKGTSFYSDNTLKRIIVIQENAHNNLGDKLLSMSVNSKYSSLPAMRHSLMHEVGHQFDEYFGHVHTDDFAQKWDNILQKQEDSPNSNPYSFNLTNDEVAVYNTYNRKSGLSDKKRFKEAVLADFKNISKIIKTTPDKIPCNIEYYADGIDFSKPIGKVDVDLADQARSEIYANLFSYAVGENDGDKEDFVNAFKNSSNVVKSDIVRKLGANALIH